MSKFWLNFCKLAFERIVNANSKVETVILERLILHSVQVLDNIVGDKFGVSLSQQL